MSDLTRPDRGEALGRLNEKVHELGDDAQTYLFVCMGILAKNAPDVCTWLLDTADAQLERLAAAVAPVD